MSSVNNGPPKLEYSVIARLVDEGASVLDLGCGDGELLVKLRKERKVERGQGIEIDEQAIYKCVAHGLSVFHGDIDSGIPEYETASFDYVILNQTFQQVKKPDIVLGEALRVGKQAIISFPNFAHYAARYQLGIAGKAPITRSLPFEWYNTPNVHFLSVADFTNYCHQRDIRIKQSVYLSREREIKWLPNWRALLGIFLITRNGK